MADFTQKQEKIFLKPMVLNIPQAVEAVNDLLSKVAGRGGEFLLTVTINNNGVSVDKTFSSLALRGPPPRLMR